MDTTPDMPSLLPDPAGASGWSWRLHVLTSGDPAWLGRVLRLGVGTWTIGREPGDVPGPLHSSDKLLSRVHLRLRVRAGAAMVAVEDLASRNGTWLNGQLSVHGEMAHGSVLRFGNTVAVLEATRAGIMALKHRRRTCRVTASGRGRFAMSFNARPRPCCRR